MVTTKSTGSVKISLSDYPIDEGNMGFTLCSRLIFVCNDGVLDVDEDGDPQAPA
jgi:hypothetical protein